MRLVVGCGTAALEPRADAVFGACSQGLALLDQTPEIPPYYTAQMLRAAKTLVSLLNDSLAQITIRYRGEAVVPTQRVAANVDILTRTYEQPGTVEGMLEQVIGHSEYKFYIYDTLTGARVSCSFTDALRDDVRQALFARAQVSGIVTFTHDGQAESVKVEHVRIMPGQADLPQFYEVRPLNITGGKDPVQFLEELYEDGT